MNSKKIISIIVLILISLIAINNITTEYNNNQKRENILPTQEVEIPEKEKEPVVEIPKEEVEEPVIEETEADKINKLFSADLNVAFAKEEFNNPDIVGRLEIPGLLNLIITQSKNNDYYSNYNINRKKDIKGNEFLDYRNNITDKQINIYGHNSRTFDIPFRKLENFLNTEFFNNNQYLIFQTDSVRRIYQIVSIKKTGSDYSHMDLSPQNRYDHITKLTSNAINKRELPYNEDTNIIVLQTCVEGQNGNYYIIVGFEIQF